MLLIVGLFTFVLIGLRLFGETSEVYKSFSHVFVGLLGGYFIGTYEWFVGVCFVSLCVTELYMVITKFFPALSIGSLLKLSNGVPPVKK